MRRIALATGMLLFGTTLANACELDDWSWQGDIASWIDFNAVFTCESAVLLVKFYEGERFLAAKKVTVDGYVVDTVVDVKKTPSNSISALRIEYKKIK